MKTLKEVIDEQQRNRAPHDDPLTDRLMAEIVHLAEEVCVLRDRLDTSEQLAAIGKLSDKASIDGFEIDEKGVEKRLARHRKFFEALLSRIGDSKSSAGP